MAKYEGPQRLATCESNGHIYGQFSWKCIFCGLEKQDTERCDPVCAYYEFKGCKCWQAEQMPTPNSGEGDAPHSA